MLQSSLHPHALRSINPIGAGRLSVNISSSDSPLLYQPYLRGEQDIGNECKDLYGDNCVPLC